MPFTDEQRDINTFKVSDPVQGFYLVREVSFKTGKNNTRYGDFILGDRTGQVDAKLWQYGVGEEEKYKPNMLIKVRGRVLAWQGQLQLRIEKIRPATDADNLSLDDFVESAPISGRDMFNQMLGYAGKIEDKDLRKLTEHLMREKEEVLFYCPGAKANHHAIKGGLLYHTLTMLKAGEKMCEVYPYLNRDLLYAGVVLHDIAKTEELKTNDLGMVTDYTSEGLLLGHITQGINLLEAAGRTLDTPREKLTLLEHMLLSHHYEPEFGSPRRPMFLEAEMLHFLDMIDTRMYDMKRVQDALQPGEFSERQWLLHNRRVLKIE
jgi:3'-5' exoribonuclease